MMNKVEPRRHPLKIVVTAIVLMICPLLLIGQGDSASKVDTTATDTARGAERDLFVYDSSAFSPRTIPADDLDAYREEDDFDYARKVAPSTSFFERLFNWFMRLLDPVVGNKIGLNIFQYGVFGAAVILVIMLLMRSELRGLFKRGIVRRKGGIEYEEVEEDIHRMDFDALIAEAIASGNLRRAVRLQYLKLLREMTERDLIEWRREKTNSDYLYELDRQDLRPHFAELTRIFDYVWYGGFEIDHSRYTRISDNFNAFTRIVQGVS